MRKRIEERDATAAGNNMAEVLAELRAIRQVLRGPAMFDREEAAAYLIISPATLDHLTDVGRLKAVEIDGETRWLRDALDAYLQLRAIRDGLAAQTADVLCKEDAAAYLTISTATLERLTSAGKLKSVKVSEGRVRLDSKSAGRIPPDARSTIGLQLPARDLPDHLKPIVIVNPHCAFRLFAGSAFSPSEGNRSTAPARSWRRAFP